MSLKSTVELLVRKHDSRDPFTIARERNITILYDDLGSMRGYYSRCLRQQFIHLNHDLLPEEAAFVCAHELGHALLHPKASTPFLRNSTFFPVSRMEREAHQFAALLTVSDEHMFELLREEVSMEQMSMSLGLPVWLAEWRLEELPLPSK